MTAAALLNPDIDESNEFVEYRFRPLDYIRERLGREPWKTAVPGTDDQVKVIEGYTLALRQLHERRDFQNGFLKEDDLQYWEPGEVIQNYISIDAGHTVGKTALLGMLCSHFFDSCPPAIVYTYAPTKEQINDLLWKEIREQREGRGLPGTIHKIPRLSFRPNHFMVGKATNNAKGQGTERTQGQHNPYMLFVIDEAEGVPSFIWNAIRSMASGGIAIVIIARNPRTRHTEAHKIRFKSNCQTYRIDCSNHPNVVHDRPIYEGMVERPYVDDMINDYCTVVDAHDPEKFTFEQPWRDGIFEPGIEYLWRVMGRPGGSQSERTICSYATYEKSQEKEPPKNAPKHIAWIGIDAARYGDDYGTLYCRHDGKIWREKRFAKQDGYEYYLGAVALCRKLDKLGVTEIYVRVDAGGGYASTVTDNLNHDHALKLKFDKLIVQEINFSRREPFDDKTFGDFLTELYWWAGNILQSYKLVNPPNELAIDLTERTYKYMRRLARDKEYHDVKTLTHNKEKFKELYGHSPDDGDGFALCAMPPFLVNPPVESYSKNYNFETAVHDFR